MAEMIKVEEIVKRYGSTEALSGVSFSVQPGEVIGLLGPNGAGKTTLMKILTGYLQPDAGQAWIDGIDVLESPQEVQARVGYLPENAPLYPELTVQSYLKMIAELRGVDETEMPALISRAVRAVGLEDRLVDPIGTLSKGFRQRVGIAQAILHRPKLLILDEPTNGLDPTQIVEVRRLIKELADTSTVLLSTHILSEVEATCSRAVIIMNGRVRADARLEELSETSRAILTLASSQVNPAAVADELKKLAGVADVAVRPSDNGRVTFEVHTDSTQDICPEIFRLAAHNDWPVAELRHSQRTLETVFNELAQEGETR